jgi:serine/threonine protein phosphatase PrpC
MLKVAEEAHKTDTGRQRHANEDSYFARAPLFAVADGMGGAQAGEVASRIAAGAFERGPRSDSDSAEGQLEEIAQKANREIHQLAQKDSSRAGMGTTLTAAMLRDDEVALGHVGDSRAYLLREGQLKRLTKDHSLVEELRRQGRLTEEQAEEHPQRSIITRALGPEPEVELDVHTHQARPRDVFLLCSDGLTSMVREERLREILLESDSLQQAVDRCVREANRMGGRDNITVVLFRVAGDEEEPAPAPEALDDTATDLSRDELRAEVGKERRPRRRLRVVAISMFVAVLLGGAAVGAIAGLRNVYFIGVDDRGLVTLYRGLPYELPAGIDLYEREYVSAVQARRLRPFERRRLLDHELRSRKDAANLIRGLERGR